MPRRSFFAELDAPQQTKKQKRALIQQHTEAYQHQEPHTHRTIILGVIVSMLFIVLGWMLTFDPSGLWSTTIYRQDAAVETVVDAARTIQADVKSLKQPSSQ